MSQVLGDVELVTKQEVEAMLTATIVTEDRINDIVNVEKSRAEAAEASLHEEIDNEALQREAMRQEITDEASLRTQGDEAIRTLLEQEASQRQQADYEVAQALQSFKTYEEEHYPNAYVCKIAGLPIAILTVHNTDKSLHVGDTIATIDEKYFPKHAVDFIMYVEQLDNGNNKTVMLTCRLDNDGNINVVNMFDVTGATAATDRVTTIYFVEE